MALGTFSLLNPPKTFLKLGFRRPITQLSAAVGPISPNLRFNLAITLQRRKNFSAVYASNDNSKEEDSLVETSDEIKASQGPPFLTILAGFVVIFLVGWTFGPY